MDPIISFKGFSFQYTAQKNPTLKNINLDIFRGEKVIICGASGSGKSTLGNCINGLIPFSYNGKITGSLTVCGIETQKASIFELSNHVGTVLQDSDGQFIGLTVAEDIAFSLENNCVPQQEMFAITSEATGSVGVSSHLDHSPQELSGGQKQRVSLAGVLVGDAEILLFDEPLANLDPRTGKGAIELIDDIYNQQNKTCIIIEHRLEDALWRKADRIILMDDGKIVADMSPDELLSTSLLIDYGIREPLYIPCCTYAGVN
ncbi:MAG: ATP-binding cassette domain-containing protein, partial [Erysipelotrichaceae bacterium]|nr:ATP-binding cassette domain-containing protein [Erysipelotrichaceae bacterium]